MQPAPRGGKTQLDLLDPVPRGLILDLDGVLWRESEPIGNLSSIFESISSRGLMVTLATNNAMNSVQDYVQKLHGFGVELEAWQIVTSGDATADTLAAAFPGGSAIYVVGERGTIQALESCGLHPETDPQAQLSYRAVVAGIDREFTYPKLQKAAMLVRAGLPFYGTNPDVTFPTPEGLVPGAGAILAAISAAAGRQPTIIGKPSALLFQTASTRMHLSPEEILVVGDRLETDVAGGQAFGARTCLVLSGVSTPEQARAWRPPPTIVAPSLGALVGA